MNADTVVLCDVVFQVVEGDRDDTGERAVVLYVELPDSDATRFGAVMSPEAADALALVLQAAAAVSDPLWPLIGLS